MSRIKWLLLLLIIVPCARATNQPYVLQRCDPAANNGGFAVSSLTCNLHSTTLGNLIVTEFHGNFITPTVTSTETMTCPTNSKITASYDGGFLPFRTSWLCYVFTFAI